MTARGNGESLCHEAREYYYELLCHHEAAVPEAVVRHVERCSFCREQISRLREALAQAENQPDTSPGPGSNESVEAISRHFELLEERVHCSQVKPFLPELLISSRQIRIPTPVTVHVDNCPQCGKDLAAIRNLGLRPDQLNRLSRFYDQAAGHSPAECPAARSAAAGLAAFSLDGADSRTLTHVSLCPRCRTWVYEQRARAIAEQCDEGIRPSTLACNEVSMADLFDFVLPFGLDVAAIRRTCGRRDAVATHVRACPQCAEKVQSLHRTVYAVAERGDSAISTVCRTESDDEIARRKTQSDAPRYPIHVEVLHEGPVPASASCGVGALSKSGRTASSRWMIAPGSRAVLAAAVLIIVALLAAIPLSTAAGISVGGIKKAAARMRNVCVTRSDGEGSAPFFEMLLATDRRIVVTKVGGQRTIYDIDRKRRIVIDADQTPHIGRLSAEEADSCMRFLTDVFDGIFRNVPETDSLTKVKGVDSGRLQEYELTRSDTGDRGTVLLQWRIFVHPASQLPMRIEYSRRSPLSPGPAGVQVTRFKYLSGSDMDRELMELQLPVN